MRALKRNLTKAEYAQLELSAKFFRGLGDPTRLKILELLLEGEKNVSELVKALGVPQGRVSNHLACLKWCGYVGTIGRGRFTYYRVTDKRINRILVLARQTIADNAERIWSCTRIGQ